MPVLKIQAGAQRDDWGTPVEVLNAVREAHGPITLDLASNWIANKTVGAKKFYTVQSPCPQHPPAGDGAVIWCNPPGPVKKVRWFWDVWLGCVSQGAHGAFLIWDLDHWRGLTPPAFGVRLYAHLCRRRLKFVGAPSQFHKPSAIVSTRELDLVGNMVRW